MSQAVIYQKDIVGDGSGIALITLNRPELKNAISDEDMIQALVDTVQTINTDQTVKVAILTGAGTAFSGGGNIKKMKNHQGMFAGDIEQLKQNYKNYIQRIPLAMEALEVPIIAAVNGPAVGAGCDLTCMCDFRIASKHASFAESFVTLGIIPGDGGAWFLPRTIGMPAAMEMALTGKMLNAKQAKKIGLVSKVVKAEKLLPAAIELASDMAKNSGRCLRETKRLFKAAQTQTLEQALDAAREIQAELHHSEDYKF